MNEVRDQTLASYQLEELHEKYHFHNPKVFMTTKRLNNARLEHVMNKVLKGWVPLGKDFRASTKNEYKESIFFKHIKALKTLMCRLDGKKYAIILRTSWVLIMARIIEQGSFFNWGAIISSH